MDKTTDDTKDNIGYKPNRDWFVMGIAVIVFMVLVVILIVPYNNKSLITSNQLGAQSLSIITGIYGSFLFMFSLGLVAFNWKSMYQEKND